MRLPKSWNEVSIEQFIEVYDIAQDESIEPLDKSIRIFSILSGLSIEQVEDLTLDEWTGYQRQITFINDFPKATYPKSFKLAGYTWKPTLDIRKITAGEYISSMELTKEKENIIINTPGLAALYLTPYKGWWLFKKKAELTYEEKKNILKGANVQQIYPLALFFCTLLMKFMENIPDYLNKTMKEIQKEVKDLTNQDWQHGDGITF